jgi:diguanylate cyclase (GGDEF)-like protein
MTGSRSNERSQINPPRPANEAERLAAVSKFEFVARQPSETLKEICVLAKELFSVEHANVALVADEEVLILTRAAGGVARVPRADSFTTWAILDSEVFVCRDIENDPRLAHSLNLMGSQRKFLAAAPLTIEPGLNIGALALLGDKPRDFSATDKAHLRRLATLAVNELLRQRGLLDLEHREALLSQATSLARLGSWEFNASAAEPVVWSDQMYRIFEVDPGEPPLTAEGLGNRVVSGADREWLFGDKREDDREREIEILNPSGGRRWVRSMVDHSQDDNGGGRVLGCMQDVTELHETRAQVERLAYRDSLTGLPNRAMFTRQFQNEIRRAEERGGRVGLLMLDLDHFKDINDTLGHDAGDALLRSVSERLVKAYRASDTVARLGGDEFAIILPDVRGEQDLIRPTEALLQLLRHPVEHGGQVFTISASVGGAIYPNDTADAAQLLKNADIALYQAKAEGRNCLVTFEPAMRELVETRNLMLREVRGGLSRDEFVLYYQPVVDITPETVTSFEALMRWNHPERGLLTPDVFKEAFEDKDLAMLLCDVTFDSAMKQMRAWLEQGVEFGRVALNVSAAQFRTPDLALQIEQKLKHWGVPPTRLTIEVTENVYMGWGSDLVGETVRRLHDSGVLIALDDFGTGYASLAHLKRFPVDRLKIDKSFVQNSGDNAIVQAVINLGANLGMEVVAEGVEGLDQLHFLTANGCDQVQGFHFGRPMPAVEVPIFLRNFKARVTDSQAGAA